VKPSGKRRDCSDRDGGGNGRKLGAVTRVRGVHRENWIHEAVEMGDFVLHKKEE